MNTKIELLKPVALLFLLSFVFVACSKQSQKKPNILFIFADDQCYDAIHALGINPEVKTPNLDRLVNQGVTFNNAYNMGAWNGAVCIASRAMLITGRSVWNAHPFDNTQAQNDLKDKGELWPILMDQAGYDTYMTGKWHLKLDADSVFDHVVHERPGMPGDAFNKNFSGLSKQVREEYKKSGDASTLMPNGYNRPQSENDTNWLPWDKSKGGFWEGGKHWSEVVGDDAINFIEQAKNDTAPFFMYLAFNAPHDPRQSPKEFVDMFPLENIAVPKSFQSEYPYKDEIGCSPTLRDEALAPFPRTEYSVKVHRQEYYAIIAHMDQQIGRILDALEASGKADNTYIFFTADHGLAVGNHGFMGKQSMYEHSMRAPLLVAGPGIKAGTKVNAPVYLQDIMASSLDLAGIEKPDYVNFNSLMPMALGKTTQSAYPAIYGCYVTNQRMIRKDGFKLIMYPKANVVRLFDLSKDPLELNDLAKQKAHQQTLAKLLNDFLLLQKEYSDPLDISSLYSKYAQL
ncbi:MAG: sulfatase-like hydrolase/transferase [Bacteroidota bacterium]